METNGVRLIVRIYAAVDELRDRRVELETIDASLLATASNNSSTIRRPAFRGCFRSELSPVSIGGHPALYYTGDKKVVRRTKTSSPSWRRLFWGVGSRKVRKFPSAAPLHTTGWLGLDTLEPELDVG